MLEGLFGNATAEKVLLYLEHYGEGYAKAIADTFEGVSLHMVQRQLTRFEREIDLRAIVDWSRRERATAKLQTFLGRLETERNRG